MNTAIFYPVFAQMILTIIMMVSMYRARRKALLAGKAHYHDIALDSSKWPDSARKCANSYSNQFELPVLFYVLCLIAYQTAGAGYPMIVLAWGFVASRAVHAYIHATSNHVPRRAIAFTVGLLVIMAMMAYILMHLLTLGV